MNNYSDHFKKMKSNAHPVRIKNNKKVSTISKKSKAKTQETSYKIAGLITFSFVVAIYGFIYPEKILEIYDRVGIFSISSADSKAVSAETKDPQAANVATDKKIDSGEPTKKTITEVSDNANYIQYLEQRKKMLDEKEKSLNELEEKLQQEKLALEQKVQDLESARRDIASRLESRVQEDEERIKKLVDMYSNMKPQSAAQVIASLDEELAIGVLKRMKKQEAGNILNFMNPEKAKKLSEKYTGY